MITIHSKSTTLACNWLLICLWVTHRCSESLCHFCTKCAVWTPWYKTTRGAAARVIAIIPSIAKINIPTNCPACFLSLWIKVWFPLQSNNPIQALSKYIESWEKFKVLFADTCIQRTISTCMTENSLIHFNVHVLSATQRVDKHKLDYKQLIFFFFGNDTERFPV